MAVRIGHASISENGSVNGVKGDQTTKEVCIRNWYSSSWYCVLRPKTDKLAEGMARACEQGCANDNIGYGQSTRNSAHDEAKKVGYNLSKINKACNTDCSAFMTICAIAGGVTELEYTGNAPTTTTMTTVFPRTGKFTKLTDSKYLNSDAYLKRGDILMKSGHTVMVLDNGSKVSNALSAVGSTTPVAKSPTKTTTTTPTDTVQVATSKASSYNKEKAGTYTTTAQLNLRHGASTTYKVMTVLPKGTKVTNYGYYGTDERGVIWLYVKVTYKNVQYSGFCSSDYLSK